MCYNISRTNLVLFCQELGLQIAEEVELIAELYVHTATACCREY